MSLRPKKGKTRTRRKEPFSETKKYGKKIYRIDMVFSGKDYDIRASDRRAALRERGFETIVGVDPLIRRIAVYRRKKR